MEKVRRKPRGKSDEREVMRMEKSCSAEIAERIPLFQDLSEQERQQLEQILIPRHAPKKTVIFSEGDEHEAVFFIRKGLVKTSKTDDKGNEQIISILKTGDMFPHTGFFHSHPYPATATAIEDTHLWAIPIRSFEQMILNHPMMAIKMLRVMGETIRSLQLKLQQLTGHDVKYRLLAFLAQLAENGGERQGADMAVHLPFTHQEIANYLGTTRETVNRLLHQLVKEGTLVADRGQVILLNWESLKERLN